MTDTTEQTLKPATQVCDRCGGTMAVVLAGMYALAWGIAPGSYQCTACKCVAHKAAERASSQ